MPRYIAIHPIDPPVNGEEVSPIAKKCKANLSTDAYWVRSWLQLTDEGKVSKVFCEWDSSDADTVRRSLAASIPELPPSEGIFEVTEIRGEDFR